MAESEVTFDRDDLRLLAWTALAWVSGEVMVPDATAAMKQPLEEVIAKALRKCGIDAAS